MNPKARDFAAMMDRTYETVCKLAPDEALHRIEELLSQEGVEFSKVDLGIASTSTPVAVLGVQRRMYTRKNWVGINPFVLVSTVHVTCQRSPGTGTLVRIRVNPRRAVLFFASWVLCAYLAARLLPLLAGVALVVGVAVLAWFGLVWFLAGRLVKQEIANHLTMEPTA